MTNLRLLARSARTFSILLAPQGVRFAQSRPVGWELVSADGTHSLVGQTGTTALFLDGLRPDTAYSLRTDIGKLDLRTLPCTGLILAPDMGVIEGKDVTAALQYAILATPEGGTLHLPPGQYVTGPIALKSNMTLYLDRAVLRAQADRTAWPILPARDADGRVWGSWEGLPEPSFAALLHGIGCHDLTITGRGVIDGGGDRGDWWDWPKETRNGARRPRTVHLAHCDRVTLTGVTVRNSPSWTVHPYRCTDLHVSAVTIRNPPDSPNTDGLNPESCERVEIATTDFSVGDDCIAIKAGKRGQGQIDHLAPTRDVRIHHCLMQRGHGAVVLGSEMSGGIHDVEIAQCEFDRTDRGLRIKTRRGRGGVVSDVRLRDVWMRDVATPLAINAHYYCDADGKSDEVQSRSPAPVDESTPQIRDISLTDVTAERVAVAAAAVLGLPEAPVTGVRLDRFSVTYDPGATADIPLMALGLEPARHAGVLAWNAEVTGTLTPQPEAIPQTETA